MPPLNTHTHTQFHKAAILEAQYYTGNFIVTSVVDGHCKLLYLYLFLLTGIC